MSEEEGVCLFLDEQDTEDFIQIITEYMDNYNYVDDDQEIYNKCESLLNKHLDDEETASKLYKEKIIYFNQLPEKFQTKQFIFNYSENRIDNLYGTPFVNDLKAISEMIEQGATDLNSACHLFTGYMHNNEFLSELVAIGLSDIEKYEFSDLIQKTKLGENKDFIFKLFERHPSLLDKINYYSSFTLRDSVEFWESLLVKFNDKSDLINDQIPVHVKDFMGQKQSEKQKTVDNSAFKELFDNLGLS